MAIMIPDDLVTIPAARLEIRRITGRMPAASTIWRWAQFGVRGVKLPTYLVGGRRFVSITSIREMILQLSSFPENGSKSTSLPSRTFAQRQKNAQRRLKNAGVLD